MLAPPPRGNPGSATAYDVYLDSKRSPGSGCENKTAHPENAFYDGVIRPIEII